MRQLARLRQPRAGYGVAKKEATTMDRYNDMSEVQKGLLAKKIIDISEEVDGAMALYVREALTRLILEGSPNITVRFTSTGGSCKAGFGIYDMLSDYAGHITGIVYGYASSMASVILQACDIRRAARHATMMLHYMVQHNISREERKNPKKRKKANDRTDGFDRCVMDIYMAKTGQSRRRICRILQDEKEFTATEALAFGLIDEIIKLKKKTKKQKTTR